MGRLTIEDLLSTRRSPRVLYFVEELVAAGLEGRDLPASLRELLLARVECEALNTLGVATCYLEDETVGLAQIQAALALAKACGDSH